MARVNFTITLNNKDLYRLEIKAEKEGKRPSHLAEEIILKALEKDKTLMSGERKIKTFMSGETK